MKNTLILLALFLFTAQGYSQQAVSASGGSVSGASGSFSFTVGQVDYGFAKNATHSVTEGVQQTFASDFVFCSGAKISDLTARVGGTNMKWYSSAVATTTLGATALLAAKTYYYTETINNTVSARTPVVVVNPIAKAGKVSATANGVASKTVCLGGDVTFVSTAYVGTAIQWQYTTDAPLSATNTVPQTWADVAGETGLTYVKTSVNNTPGTKFYIRAKYTSGSCTTAYSIASIITVDPTSFGGTVTGGGIICSGTGGTLKLATNIGKTIQWLSSANGTDYTAVPLATKTSLVVTGLTQDSWYKAQVTSGACSSAFSSVVKFEIGNAATVGIVSADATSICKGTGTTLHLSSGNYGSILWEKSTNGTTWASANNKTTTLVTPLLTASTYYRATTYIGTSATVNCLVAHSEPVLVSIIAAPIAKSITGSITSPTGSSSSPLCTTNASKVLTIGAGSSGSIQWQKYTPSTSTGFDDIDGETGLSYAVSNPTVGANYFKAKFTNSCGVSAYSAAVTVYYNECGASKFGETELAENQAFSVLAYPNPFNESFNLSLTTSSESKVGIMVYDMLGKLLEQSEVRPTEVSEVQIGDQLPTGIYNIIVNQGEDFKMLRVLKK